jgi:hypothetical protein
MDEGITALFQDWLTAFDKTQSETGDEGSGRDAGAR